MMMANNGRRGVFEKCFTTSIYLHQYVAGDEEKKDAASKIDAAADHTNQQPYPNKQTNKATTS
jgi:hypothetical protein